MRFIFASLLAVAGFSLPTGSHALAAPAPSPAPSAASAATTADPVDDPKINKIALDQIEVAKTGKLDRSLYSAVFNKQITDDVLASMAKSMHVLGKPTAFKFVTINVVEGLPTYRYIIVWPQLTLLEDIALDPAGKITLVHFQQYP